MLSACKADLGPKIIRKSRFHATLLGAILFVLISNGSMKAQDQGYGEQVMRNQYLNPGNMVEKDRFVRQMIGHTGDLNLSIKLMNIPGRNRLDYSFLAQYHAGVRVDQEASVIGLGWHLDLGGVRRIYRTMPDYVNTHMGDRFSLSIPEGSFRFSNYGTSSPDFKFDRWNGWKIEYQSFSPAYISGDNCFRSDALPIDFTKFIVTNNDGIKYVYALALKRGEFLQGCMNLNAPYIGNVEWLLTAILSADYVDGGGADPYNPLDSSSPVSDNGGSWIAIEYLPIRNLHYEFPGHESIMLPLLTQVTVPHQIITPTHVAQFEVEDRHQNYLSYYERKSNNAPAGYAFPDNTDYELQKRVKNIKLYSISNYNIATRTIISPSSSIEEVHFEYASPSNSLAPSTLSAPNSYGKTTLTKIHLKGMNGSITLPPFEFEYYVDPADFVSSIYEYNPQIWLDASGSSSINTARDYLNYYDNSIHYSSGDEAKAWSLNKITFPWGGYEEYDYENDKAPVLNTGIVSAGGVRVISVTVSDGINTPSVFQYSYGTNGDGVGYLTSHPIPCLNCVAPPVPPFYLTANNAIDHYVAYAIIQETLPNNNGKIRRYYTSTYDLDQSVSYASNSYMRVRLSLDHQRGLLYKEEYYDNVSNLSKVVEQNYGYDTMAQRSVTFGTVCSGCTFEVDRSVFVKLNSTTTKDYSIYSQSDFVTTVVSYDEYNPINGLLRKKTETNSDGTKRITKWKYPVDYTNSTGNGDVYEQAIHAMRTTKHMYSPVIEKEIREQPSGQSEKVIAAELVKFKQVVANGQYYPHEIKVFSNPTFVANFVESNIAGGTFNSDSRYQIKSSNDDYDFHGNLILSKDAQNPATPTATVWAYNSSLPVGQVRNATPSQVAVRVFDDGDVTGWTGGSSGTWVVSNGIYQQTDNTAVPWGSPRFLNTVGLKDGVWEADVRFDEPNTPKYLGLFKYVNASDFIRFQVSRTASNPGVRIFAQKGGNSVAVDASKTLNAGKWYHLRGEIQGTLAKIYLDGELLATMDHAYVDIASGKIGIGVYQTNASFDNVRLYPLNALATSTSYDPVFFKINARSDENGNRRFFTYDNFDRLQTVSDASGRVVQEHSYFYSYPFSATNPNHVQTALATHVLQVPNYDFEEGASSPTSWFAISSGGSGSWENTVAYSCFKSLKAQIPSSGPSNYVRWYTASEPLEKVSSPKNYRFEVWMQKASGSSGGSISFTLTFHNASHALSETQSTGFPLSALSTSWQKFTLDFTTIAASDHLYEIAMELTPNSNGTVWFDRVNLNERNITKAFADGLVRAVQTQQHEGTGAIKTATVYDVLSHVQKVIKPYPSATQAFAANPTADANSYYSSNHPVYYDGAASQEYDTNPYAYAENEYYADPLNRVRRQAAPGTAFRMGTGKEIVFDYWTNGNGEVPGYSVNTLFKQGRNDEDDGKITNTFTDRFGNTVATVVDPGNPPAQLNLITTFKYDVLGNLLESKDPRTLPTTYVYNTLSQLRQKTTPDAGTVEYLYDKNGNLRFVKDAKGAAGNSYFIYYKFDIFNRQIEEGTVAGVTTFMQDSADISIFPTTTGHTWKVKYYYDSSPNVALRNLAGRLYRIDYASDTYPAMTGFLFYSYDANGNVERIEQFVPKSNVNDGNGLLSSHIDYQYDALGKITKTYFRRTFPPGVSTDAFYTWYDYDGLGRLEKVFTNTADAKPWAANATYTYWPSGQVRRLALGNNLQGVDYLYNSRDWLTQINHQSLSSSSDPGGDAVNLDRFGQTIGYNSQKYIASDADYAADFDDQFNGNISWLTLNTDWPTTSPDSATGWVFQYDKANRLSKGNWGRLASPVSTNWSATNRYDVTGITYDANGNLSTMTRRDQLGSATAMTYNYLLNTNKLDNVGGLNNPGNYGYDANGNMVKDAAKINPTTNTIVYDYRNLPRQISKSVAPAGMINFSYDGKGQRVSKNDLFYVYGVDGRVMAVYDANGTHLYWNILGLDLIGQKFWKQ